MRTIDTDSLPPPAIARKRHVRHHWLESDGNHGSENYDIYAWFRSGLPNGCGRDAEIASDNRGNRSEIQSDALVRACSRGILPRAHALGCGDSTQVGNESAPVPAA